MTRIPAAAQEALPSLYQPAPSPDGSEIAFVSGGDIWTVPADGGEARIVERPTESVEAYQWYLKGRFFLAKRTERSLERAQRHRDPSGVACGSRAAQAGGSSRVRGACGS